MNLVTEWILAFDADCRFCEEVVDRVRVSVDGTLTTAGLTEPRIRGLRARALGERAEWAPTLLAVDGHQVRAWTGTALSLRLARLLGPSESLRVVRALRDLDVLRPPSRRGILKAVPGLALGTFLVTGGLAASPAQAVARAKGSKASRWVKANLDRLPSGYSEFVSYPADYRRAIYGSLSSSARSDLWVAHFADYRKTYPGLTARQSAVLDDATRLAPQIIAGRQQGAAVEGLTAAAVAAFGESGARAVLMSLGPADTQSAAPRSDQNIQVLDCNSQCAGSGSCDTVCYDQSYCNWTDYGCGPLWLGPCSGFCIP
ncbi:bacteriocin fulvocin C-related protein [Streptomyces sp. NBC_01435]|uniref:bacteriocin fulvocin C-related protein n=1 Tax=Streptomyces sp. NBC_01435 TaxID=2903865 RepID=UPI002E3120C1|nr:bacteriocin fulvocin C-related protein [Streptomyces sp. NBC_01435]